MERTRATRRQHNTVNKQAENSMKILCSCLKDNSRVRKSSRVDGGVKSSRFFFFSLSKYLWEFIFEQTAERQQREPLEPASTGLQFTSVVECVWTRSNQPERPDIALDEEASFVSRRYEIALTFYGI